MLNTNSVAVSMPIGSWHPFLPAVLDSLCLQSVPVELAVLDASNDTRVSNAIAQSRITPTYLRTGPDSGQASAIDEGWRNTCSSFVTWLNADDLLMPGALQKLIQALEQDDIDVAYGGSTIIDNHGQTVGYHSQVADVDDMLYRSNCISQPSALVRRSAIEEIQGINTDLHYTMDWDLWQRLYENGSRFQRLDECLSAVFWGQGTKTSTLNIPRMNELFRLTNRHTGPVSAIKTVVSSTLQTLRGHRGSAPLSPGLYFSADKNPRESAKSTLAVPVVNTSNYTANQMIVLWEGGTPSIRPRSCGVVSDKSTGQACVDIPQGIKPTQCVIVDFDANLNESTRLLRLKLEP